MKRSYYRLCALLSLSNFSKKELMDIAFTLQETPVDKLVWDVRKVGDDLGRLDSITSEAPFEMTEDMELVDKISDLLLNQARLSKRDAAELLRKELMLINSRGVQSLNRESFSAWLKRLTAIASRGEILHAATNIRNRRVHSTSDDWLK